MALLSCTFIVFILQYKYLSLDRLSLFISYFIIFCLIIVFYISFPRSIETRISQHSKLISLSQTSKQYSVIFQLVDYTRGFLFQFQSRHKAFLEKKMYRQPDYWLDIIIYSMSPSSASTSVSHSCGIWRISLFVSVRKALTTLILADSSGLVLQVERQTVI